MDLFYSSGSPTIDAIIPRDVSHIGCKSSGDFELKSQLPFLPAGQCPPEVVTLSGHGATHTSPRFPQEIFDAIIDAFAHRSRAREHPRSIFHGIESGALKKCALVCRGWRPRAQFWLFNHVVLEDQESLRKLESQLNLRSEYISGIQDITIHCGNGIKHPVQNVLAAVCSLTRRCPNLRALCLDDGGSDPDKDMLPTHQSLPFHSRFHSALFRQSFSTVTVLVLHCIGYHSDTDFLTFVLSFVSLEELILERVSWIVFHTMKEEDYMILLKKRQGAFRKLRSLHMVCGSVSGRCSQIQFREIPSGRNVARVF